MKIILSGGSIFGLAHIGALNVINKIDKIDKIIGIGIGGFIGALYAIGYNPTELEIIFKDIDFKKLIKDGNILFEKKLKKLIYAKLGNKYIKFIDIDFDLTILCFNLNKQKITELNKINTPNLKIYKAIMIACSFPFTFFPIKYKGNNYIDGIIPLEYAINLIDEYKIIIDLKLINHELKSIKNYGKYIETLIHDYEKEYKEAITIKILYKWDKFKLSKKDKNKLFNIGVESALKWINLF